MSPTCRIEIILGCMFSGKSTEMMRRCSREEIIGKKIDYKFKATNYDGRYKYTPYKFTPNLGKKLILNPSIDFAQGILKCLEEIYNKNHK